MRKLQITESEKIPMACSNDREIPEIKFPVYPLPCHLNTLDTLPIQKMGDQIYA